jgi:hypothetical protein
MPCNLAVSITKAAVTDERLRALLTPEAIGNVVLTYLQRNFASSRSSLLLARGNVLSYSVGDLTLTIADGRVDVDGSQGQVALAEKLATDVTGLLAAAGDRLFQGQVQQALRSVTTRAQSVDVTLEEENTARAAVFHVNVNLPR